jgi:hypothetical protein
VSQPHAPLTNFINYNDNGEILSSSLEDYKSNSFLKPEYLSVRHASDSLFTSNDNPLSQPMKRASPAAFMFTTSNNANEMIGVVPASAATDGISSNHELSKVVPTKFRSGSMDMLSGGGGGGGGVASSSNSKTHSNISNTTNSKKSKAVAQSIQAAELIAAPFAASRTHLNTASRADVIMKTINNENRFEIKYVYVFVHTNC